MSGKSIEEVSGKGIEVPGKCIEVCRQVYRGVRQVCRQRYRGSLRQGYRGSLRHGYRGVRRCQARVQKCQAVLGKGIEVPGARVYRCQARV